MSKLKINVYREGGAGVVHQLSVVDAAAVLDCPLEKPSLARFGAWCRKNGYVVSLSENEQPDEQSGAGDQGENPDQDQEQSQEEQEQSGNPENSEAAQDQQQQEGEGEEDQNQDDANAESDNDSQDENQSSEGSNDDDDDPFVKRSELNTTRAEMESEFFDAFAETKSFCEDVDMRLIGEMSVLKDEQSAFLEKANKALKAAKRAQVVNIKMPDSAQQDVTDQHVTLPDLLASVATKEPTFMVGPAGSGKTHAAEHVAKIMKLPFHPMSVGEQTTQSHLIGFIDAHGKYHTTPFRNAFEGGGIFLLDEIDAGNANTITVLNAALSNGYMSFPDKTVSKHKDFICIAAANTYGNGSDRQYVGRNQLDAASLDRFNFLEWNYDEALEQKFSTNVDWTQKVQAYRAAVSKAKLRHVVSPRASIKGAKLLAAGLSEKKVIDMVIFKGLKDGDIKRVNENLKLPTPAKSATSNPKVWRGKHVVPPAPDIFNVQVGGADISDIVNITPPTV